MSRLSLALIAAVLAVGFGSVQLAQSQPETAPPAGQTTPSPKAKKSAMTPEEKAKRQECAAQGKQDKLKGPKLKEFVQTCVGG